MRTVAAAGFGTKLRSPESQTGTAALGRVGSRLGVPHWAGLVPEREVPHWEFNTVEVFDVAGRKVQDLVDRVEYSTGRYEVSWDGSDVSGSMLGAGTYFARITLGNKVFSRKIVRTR